MSRLKTISLLFPAIFFSCQLINLEQVGITTYPAEREAVLGGATPVWIEFSCPVRREGAEMLLKVLSPSGNVPGDLSWENTRLIFTPRAPYDPGIRYVLSFNGEIRTEDGRRRTVSAVVPFFSVSADLPARLMDCQPPDGSIVGAGDSLLFIFSKSMDTSLSLDDFFTLAPTADLNHEWSGDGTRLLVHPMDAWEPLEYYTWTVSSDLKDSAGIRLVQEYSGGFLVQNPAAPAPLVVSLEPAVNSWSARFPLIPFGVPLTAGADRQADWIGWRDALRITFQFASPPLPGDPAAVDLASLQKAFSIEPAVKGVLQCVKTIDGAADDFFVFIPESGERFLRDTWYHVAISRDCKNREGVQMREAFEGWFTADIPEISVPQITVADNRPDDLLIAAAEFNSYVPFPVTVNAAEPPRHFIIDFNAAFTIDAADRYRIADHVTLAKVFPESVTGYGRQNVAYLPGDPNRLTVTFDGVPAVAGSMFCLRVKGGPDGVTDSQGAYLEEDVFIYFMIDEVIP